MSRAQAAQRPAGAIAAALVAAALIAACASTPPEVPAQAEEDDEPVLLNRPLSQPMVEYPPIEPVEPPEAVHPPAPTPVQAQPAPSPVIIAPPSAPATVPPPVIAKAAPPPEVAAPAPTPAPAPPPEISAEEREVNALLADLNRYGALSGDDVKREIGTATNLLSRQRTDANRIRLAVLYTLARNPADDQRALQLFDNVLKGTAANGASMRALAAVLQLQVAERVRAVRDEQRKSEVAVQKLEALREMERSLLRDRIRGGGGGAAGGGGGSSGGGSAGGGAAGR